MSETLVACCQLALAVGQIERNRAALRAAIEGAAGAGADVVVLPELAPSGYVFRDGDEARALAEPVDGPTITEWAALAAEHDLVLAGGFCELAADGRVHNSAVLLDQGGVRAVYRKVHLWDLEPDSFVPGHAPPPVVETRVGRVALVVCYDLEFPEWVRLPAIAGAQLLCAPVNWPDLPRPAGERPAEVVRVQANAAVNRMFIAACDRAGHERGVDWVGGSVVVDADGFPLAGPAHTGETTTLLASCRLGDALDKHAGPRNHVHADRRPELYEAREPVRAT